jgi:hypothetical protein
MWKRVLITGFLAVPLTACPVCHTGTGRQVRAGIFTTGFSKRVLLTLAPFPAFLTIVGLIYYRFPIPAGGGGRRWLATRK